MQGLLYLVVPPDWMLELEGGFEVDVGHPEDLFMGQVVQDSGPDLSEVGVGVRRTNRVRDRQFGEPYLFPRNIFLLGDKNRRNLWKAPCQHVLNFANWSNGQCSLQSCLLCFLKKSPEFNFGAITKIWKIVQYVFIFDICNAIWACQGLLSTESKLAFKVTQIIE